MIALSAGWSLSSQAGTNAVRSQLATLAAMAAVGRPIEIAPLSVRSSHTAAASVRIRATRVDPGVDSTAQWAPLEGLPAGTYAVKVVERRPRGGRLVLRIGRSAEPVATLTLEPRSEQTLALDVQGGASTLSLEPDAVLSSVGERIEFTPVTVRSSAARYATGNARFGSASVFFLDDAVFVESDGFWVRGGRTAEMTVVPAEPQGRMSIELMNGAAQNRVVVDIDGVSQTVPLAASDSRTVEAPVAADGTLSLRISSPAGFKPSETGSSRDARYLGVRVRLIVGN
jgi:hypothetical protein